MFFGKKNLGIIYVANKSNSKSQTRAKISNLHTYKDKNRRFEIILQLDVIQLTVPYVYDYICLISARVVDHDSEP